MNAQEVGQWVAETCGLPEYSPVFVDNDITFAELVNLNTQDLKDMNITKVGHRKRIELAIYSLKLSRQQPQLVTQKRKNTFPSEKDAKRTKHDSPVVFDNSAMDIIDDMKSLLLTGLPGVCTICQEDKDTIFHLQKCNGGAACIECLQAYFRHQIESKAVPITCHDKVCKHEIMPSDLQTLLKKNEMERFERVGIESMVAPLGINFNGKQQKADKFKFLHCPTPNCSYIFALDPNDEEAHHLRCELCKEHYCLKCRVKYHKGKSCITYRKDTLSVGEETLLLLAYLHRNKVKACPQCAQYVERSSGCQHMSCICGAEFCYLCANVVCTCKPGTIDVDYHEEEDSDEEFDSEMY
jgi:hypothetical protein